MWFWCIPGIKRSSNLDKSQLVGSFQLLNFCKKVHFTIGRGSADPSTHTRLTALFPGLPRSAGTRNVKPIWILLKQETVSGSGISWAICKSASCSRQTNAPAPHHSVFTGRMPFLPPNQQRQSTEGRPLQQPLNDGPHITSCKRPTDRAVLVS